MLEKLKEEVCIANKMLKDHHLVTLTWGNVSGIDRDSGLVVIKPSGVHYEELTPEKMVVISLDSGKVVEGELNPSSDTPTHLALYREFLNIKGIVHTHSTYATSWAQAGLDIPCFGTTHADYFYGSIPCTSPMAKNEIESNYEYNTGLKILDTFKERSIKPANVPSILVHSHGPFTWGKNPLDAIKNAIVLEEVAKIAFNTLAINSNSKPIDQTLLDKHFLRKHGENSYYGQKTNN